MISRIFQFVVFINVPEIRLNFVFYPAGSPSRGHFAFAKESGIVDEASTRVQVCDATVG